MADTDWITDRRPTEADGDGDVRVRYSPVSEDYSYLHWSHVGTGVPWIHCDDWKPSAPEPPTTTPRKFKETPRRTVWMDGGGSQAHTLDAIADDGSAWWMVVGETTWLQTTPLPAREVQANV